MCENQCIIQDIMLLRGKIPVKFVWVRVLRAIRLHRSRNGLWNRWI